MIEHVLCARDFSPSSERALGYALELVERTGATLHLMHIQETPLGPFVQGDPSPDPGDQALQQQFEERCRDELSAFSFTPDDNQLTCVAARSGAVAPALVRYAKAHAVDLVVMGTQGRRGVERAICGSVAEEVLRTAPCPVLTTRAIQEDKSQPHRPDPIDQVVAPIDFSEPSRAALRYAGRLASTYEVPLTLVHAIHVPKLPPAYGVEFSAASQQDLEQRVLAELESWNEDVAPAGTDGSCVVKRGEPVASILDAASTPGDLLVMATRGLSGLKRTMLGSVAEGVLRQAKGPVLSGRSFPMGS
jgi:nucleotide-binding universal stress UspA family protein